MNNRRTFLTNATIFSSGAFLIPSFFGCGKNKSPNDLINIAAIGLGSHGIANVNNYLKFSDLCRIVAVCDVYKPLAENAKKIVNKAYRNRDCKVYQDFRDILARPDIDAIQITTPDHWHVPMSIIALNSGKHVSCEKPTHTIQEGRMLVDTVNKSGKVFSVAVEDRFLPVYHQMAELVKNGRIGELQKIYVELPVRDVPMDGFEFTNPPKGFDYELWCGPAPVLPYCKSRCFYNFRWNKHYGGGTLSDWLPHQGETAQWISGYDLSGPEEVQPLKPAVFHSGIYNTIKEFDILFKYKNGIELEVKNGIPWIRAIGSEGWIESKGWNKPLTASDPKLLELPEDKIALPTDKSELYNFLQALKTGGQPIMTAEFGHRTSTVCHLGNIAAELNRKLIWNPKEELFVNDEEANDKRGKIPREEWSYKKVLNMSF